MLVWHRTKLRVGGCAGGGSGLGMVTAERSECKEQTRGTIPYKLVSSKNQQLSTLLLPVEIANDS